LILLLAVAPLLLLGLPSDIVQWLTRPRAVDAVLTRLSRPPVAIVVVTVLAVGSMIPVLVHLQSTSPLARGIEDGVTVVAGLVLWIPVLGRIPGITRPRPVVRFGYLVAQAVTPAFLSFIYIFSRHPLYPGFAASKVATGLQPLNDQQVAGFVSKLTMLVVLLTVGGVVLSRTQATDEDLGEVGRRGTGVRAGRPEGLEGGPRRPRRWDDRAHRHLRPSRRPSARPVTREHARRCGPAVPTMGQ